MSAPGFSPERWREIVPRLDEALELDPGERAAWLAGLRARDPALASDVQGLLEERTAVEDERFLEDTAPVLPAMPSLEGQPIGPYTLVSLVGRGGMGSVWLARRSDGRFEGTAAVKLLNADLIGRAGGERFVREGAFLARLTHPHIAHLVDAGVSPLGQPYLILEHVDGEPIDRYCDARRLGIEERLRVFLDVLAAVAHAHARLIVHRDLKPSNVLVRKDGCVKLLDFGIAKLLEGEETPGEATALTREGGRALTPEYAAPEQLTGEPITTATDVYSLGTLLYLLLAGRHPAGPSLGAPADLLRATLETEPPRPSDVVADRLGHRLRGDLDTIVGKALKKKPDERYPSVTAFAEDVQRHLDHRPIGARADSLAYRTTKFARRNRAAVALALAGAVALAGGVVATAVQARRAARQAARADAERDFALRQLSRAEAINDLNSFLLSDAAPSGKPFTAGELLARAERVVDREQGESAENRVEMLVAIGRQYQIQDEDANARRLLVKAHALASTLSDRSVRAKAGCALASAVARTGELSRAEGLLAEALRDLPDEPQFALHRVFCLMRGGEIARHSGDGRTAIARVEEAQRRLRALRLPPALVDVRLAIDLAEAYRIAGRHREASAACEKAQASLAALGREDTETEGTLLNNWGLSLAALGRPLEAEGLYRRAIRIGSRDGTDQGVSPMLLANLAFALIELGRVEEAKQCAQRAYALARRAGDEVVVNQSLGRLVTIDLRLGDVPAAAERLAELEPRWRPMPAGHMVHALLASYRSLLARARGDLPAAIAAADEAVALARSSPQASNYLATLLLGRSDLDLQVERLAEARADAMEALQIERERVGSGSPSSGVGRAGLALSRALRAEGRLDEARAEAVAALDQLLPSLGEDHADTREARLAAGR